MRLASRRSGIPLHVLEGRGKLSPPQRIITSKRSVVPRLRNPGKHKQFKIWDRLIFDILFSLLVLGCIVSPKIHVHPEPANVILSGNRVFTNIIELRWILLGLGWGLIRWLCSYKKKEIWTLSHAEETCSCEGRGRERGFITKERW